MTLYDEMKKVVSAAKTWSRADDTSRERREKRLRNAVERYVAAERKAKDQEADRRLRERAAEEGEWVDGAGKRTPLTELDGKHLYHIRRKIRVDSPHHDGICEEIRRRAEACEHPVVWADGVPYVYERRVQNGDEAKLSFRNVLTRKLEHVEEDREGFVTAWSGYMGHGLTGDMARTLHEAAAAMLPIEDPKA